MGGGEYIKRAFGYHIAQHCLSTILLKGLYSPMFLVCLLWKDLRLEGAKEEA